MMESLKAISVRKDIGETLRDKLFNELQTLRAAAVTILKQEGYPGEDGVYMEVGSEYKRVSREQFENAIGQSSPDERKSFVRFPFFRFERLSRADLAAALIFEIDLMVADAESNVDGWDMVSRALRFASAYHDFVFETSGANYLADAEVRGKTARREGLKEHIRGRQERAKSWQDAAALAAREMKRKNPALSTSAIAERLAARFQRSGGHMRRVLRAHRCNVDSTKSERELDGVAHDSMHVKSATSNIDLIPPPKRSNFDGQQTQA
ncbi:MAG: hypothetical protein Q8P46_12825 [Hyphomicrobiales bacterium]|nr:hypothetical protein [Hyphomicrobiales bacterium]